MSRALFTAVTGMQVHQARLDVVANNIANVNTTGYRGSRMLFQDLFSQTLSGASAPSATFGGANGQQIGLGVKVGSIDISFEQGALLTTGISSDLAIQGNGFFIMSDGGLNSYTRDGSFTVNTEGVLIDPATGLKVQGYTADATGTIPVGAPLGDIVIPVGENGIVQETANAFFVGNLNPTRDPDFPAVPKVVTRTIEVYDSLGTPQEIELTITQDDPVDNTWEVVATYGGTPLATPFAGELTFDTSGDFVSFTPSSITLDPADTGSTADPLVFALDLSDVTQLADDDGLESDMTLRNQDGFPRGVLELFNIGIDGTINGIFSNGLTQAIAQVAIADFANVGGLSRNGNNSFLETTGSGVVQVGRPGVGGMGTIAGGVLENSNVDLSTEFSNMIITQRGFQANARTITAADTMLQETVNLVR